MRGAADGCLGAGEAAAAGGASVRAARRFRNGRHVLVADISCSLIARYRDALLMSLLASVRDGEGVVRQTHEPDQLQSPLRMPGHATAPAQQFDARIAATHAVVPLMTIGLGERTARVTRPMRAAGFVEVLIGEELSASQRGESKSPRRRRYRSCRRR